MVVAEKFLAQPEKASLQKTEEKTERGKERIVWTERILFQAFIDLQFTGLLCVYLAVRAHYKGREVTTSGLRQMKSVDLNYYVGTTAAFKSVDLWDYKVVKDVHVLSSVNEILSQNVEKWLDSVIAVYKQRDDDPATLNYLQMGKTEIDEFLGSKSRVQTEAKKGPPSLPPKA